MIDDIVSVIITTYGRDFSDILPAIRSVFAQTYKNYEVILVDDNGLGSEMQKKIEKSIGISEYKDRIKYVPNIKNSGAQISRNNGILHSSGKFIAFLDDDDDWDSKKLGLQVGSFSDETVALVYSKGWDITLGDDGSKIIEKPYNMSGSFITELGFADLSYGDYIGTTTQAMVRKAALAKTGLFDIMQPARQDYEMWIRISQFYRCVGVDEYLFRHYHHSGEQISKSEKKNIIGLSNIYRKYHKKMSFTARWHLLYLITKSCIKEHKAVKLLNFGTRMLGYFLLAQCFDRKEYKKRVQLHKKRLG